MRKFVKLMSITTMAATIALQVTACKDDSQYNSFISEVNKSSSAQTAFFGFLGSADDDTSIGLQNSFNFLLNSPDGQATWKKWMTQEFDQMLAANGLSALNLRYYQGPYHQNKPSDPIDAFWNDKNISWQRNIFNWVYSRANNDNPDFNRPRGQGVTQIDTKKDGKGNDMFQSLPIVFIIANGKLMTAGQGWLSSTDPIPNRIQAIHDFITSNLFGSER